ncbi:MAG TPA: VOC family protein, partial [Puia sp.]|nr:VOC family protein [Puia sp.]
MLDINPYLHFPGNAWEAMSFYRYVFGGEFTTVGRYGDLPGAEKMPPGELDKLIHICLTIGNGHTIMATDMLESMGQELTTGDNFHIC